MQHQPWKDVEGEHDTSIAQASLAGRAPVSWSIGVTVEATSNSARFSAFQYLVAGYMTLEDPS